MSQKGLNVGRINIEPFVGEAEHRIRREIGEVAKEKTFARPKYL